MSHNDEVETRIHREAPYDGTTLEAWDASPSQEPVTSSLMPPDLKIVSHGDGKPFYLRNPLTTFFVLLLILIYAGTTYHQDFRSISDWAVLRGGFYAPLVAQGEWWRFVSASLLHANPSHLFNNVVGLLIFGNLLENVLGTRVLLGLYALSLLFGFGLSALMNPNGMSIGASTIDYGLIGAYLSLILVMRYRYDRSAFLREFRGAVLFVLVFIIWNTMESATINVWGHVGGLVAGVVCSLLLAMARRRQPA